MRDTPFLEKVGDALIFKELGIHDAFVETLKKEQKTQLPHTLAHADQLKKQVRKIEQFYRSMNMHFKADTLKHCGTWREYHANKPLTKIKLNRANFCKDSKFCPFCADRKQKKDAFTIATMVRALDPTISLQLVTLTIPNIQSDLGLAIDLLNYSFKKLINQKDLKKVYLGAIKSVEVTYSDETGFHPHLHVLFAFKNSVESRNWISKQKWFEMWSKCTDLAISRDCLDIKRVKNISFWDEEQGILSNGSAVFGYLAKQKIKLDKVKTVETFEELYHGTYRKNMLSFHGLFKDLKAQFKAGELDRFKPQQEDFEAYYRIIVRWLDKSSQHTITEMQEIAKNPADQIDQAG